MMKTIDGLSTTLTNEKQFHILGHGLRAVYHLFSLNIICYELIFAQLNTMLLHISISFFGKIQTYLINAWISFADAIRVTSST